MAFSRRHPRPVPGFGEEFQRDVRRAGVKLERYLKKFGFTLYLGTPQAHTHEGGLGVTGIEDTEQLAWVAFQRADE